MRGDTETLQKKPARLSQTEGKKNEPISSRPDVWWISRCCRPNGSAPSSSSWVPPEHVTDEPDEPDESNEPNARDAANAEHATNDADASDGNEWSNNGKFDASDADAANADAESDDDEQCSVWWFSRSGSNDEPNATTNGSTDADAESDDAISAECYGWEPDATDADAEPDGIFPTEPSELSIYDATGPANGAATSATTADAPLPTTAATTEEKAFEVVK